METNGSQHGPAPASFLPRKTAWEELVTHWESADFAIRYPALYQLLCYAKADGHYRAGATLSFFCEMGRLKASIYDRASQMVWFGCLEGEGDLIGEVDKLIQAGHGEWRQKKNGK